MKTRLGDDQSHRPTGRKALPNRKARAVSERLREHVRGQYGSQAAFARKVGLPNATLSGWLNPLHPHTPDVPQLVAMAEKANISIDWLLLGEASETVEAAPSDRGFKTRLRQAVIGMLANVKFATRRELEELVPEAGRLFETFVNTIEESVRERLSEHRELRAMRKEISSWVEYGIEGSDKTAIRRIRKGRRSIADAITRKLDLGNPLDWTQPEHGPPEGITMIPPPKKRRPSPQSEPSDP